MKTFASIALTLCLAVTAVACGSDSDSESGSGDGPTVSATTGIVADITAQVAGDDATVEQVIPDSASPHDFSLSAQDRARIEDSALLVSREALSLDELNLQVFEVVVIERKPPL